MVICNEIYCELKRLNNCSEQESKITHLYLKFSVIHKAIKGLMRRSNFVEFNLKDGDVSTMNEKKNCLNWEVNGFANKRNKNP